MAHSPTLPASLPEMEFTRRELEDHLRFLCWLSGKYPISQDQGQTPQRLLNRLHRGEIRLVIAGEFGTGKTSFVNRFLGSPILHTGLVPVTAARTIVEHGPRLQAAAILKGNRPVAINHENQGHFSANGAWAEQLEAIHVTAPLPILQKGLKLVDTPGVNSPYPHHVQLAKEEIRLSNACVFLMDMRQPGKKTTIEFLKDVLQQQPEKMFFVFNRADICSPEERKEAGEYFCSRLPKEFGIFEDRLEYLSSTPERTGNPAEWAMRFQRFMDRLNTFMKKEKQVVIARETIRLTVDYAQNAQLFLHNRRRPLEQQLAILYKTPFPDSQSIIENLKGQAEPAVDDVYPQVRQWFDNLFQEQVRGLRSDAREIVMRADSRKALAEEVPGRLDRRFRDTGDTLTAALQNGISAMYSQGRDLVDEAFTQMFQGIRHVRDRFNWKSVPLWATVISSYSIGLLVDAFRSESVFLPLFGFGFGLLSLAVFALIDRKRRRHRFSMILPRSFYKRVAFDSGTKGSELVRNELHRQQAPKKNLELTVKGSYQVFRGFGAQAGLIAGGIGLAIVGLQRLWQALTGPSLDKLKGQMLQQVRERCDELEKEAGAWAEETFDESYDSVVAVLGEDIRYVVARYESELALLAERHRLKIAFTEADLDSIRKEIDECHRRETALRSLLNNIARLN